MRSAHGRDSCGRRCRRHRGGCGHRDRGGRRTTAIAALGDRCCRNTNVTRQPANQNHLNLRFRRFHKEYLLWLGGKPLHRRGDTSRDFHLGPVAIPRESTRQGALVGEQRRPLNQQSVALLYGQTLWLTGAHPHDEREGEQDDYQQSDRCDRHDGQGLLQHERKTSFPYSAPYGGHYSRFNAGFG